MMQALWLASVAGMGVAVARIGWLRLAQSYRFFALYLVLNVLSGPVLYLAGDPRSREYFAAWIAIDPILQLALLLSVAEVYGLVAGHYPRLGVVGSYLIGGAAVLSGVLCVATAAPELANLDALRWAIPLGKFVYLAHRWTATIALGALLITLGFFRWFNRPLAPNVSRHAAILSVYLAAHSVGWLMLLIAPASAYQTVDMVRMLVSAACGIAWSFSFSKAGQVVRRQRETTADEFNEARGRQQALLAEAGRARPLG